MALCFELDSESIVVCVVFWCTRGPRIGLSCWSRGVCCIFCRLHTRVKGNFA